MTGTVRTWRGPSFEFDEVQDIEGNGEFPVLAYLHTPHKEEVTAKNFPW